MPVITPTGGGGGGANDFAVVRLAGVISPWDGSALAFDSVVADPQGLWDATAHQFVAQTRGWYQVTCSPQNGGGNIQDTAPGGSVIAAVGGPGDNVGAGLSYPIGPALTEWVYPPVVGVVRLRVGDTLDIEGTAGGTLAAGGLTFAIVLAVAV